MTARRIASTASGSCVEFNSRTRTARGAAPAGPAGLHMSILITRIVKLTCADLTSNFDTRHGLVTFSTSVGQAAGRMTA